MWDSDNGLIMQGSGFKMKDSGHGANCTGFRGQALTDSIIC